MRILSADGLKTMNTDNLTIMKAIKLKGSDSYSFRDASNCQVVGDVDYCGCVYVKIVESFFAIVANDQVMAKFSTLPEAKHAMRIASITDKYRLIDFCDITEEVEQEFRHM